MLKVFIFTSVLLLLAILFLGIKIFFTKSGKFPQTRIGNNKDMKKKGIYCAKTLDAIERKDCQTCNDYHAKQKATASSMED